MAISADGERWFLLNASPDLLRQIDAFPPLHPHKSKLRSSPISGVLLTNADLDHTLGLLLLREGDPLSVYSTQSVRLMLSKGLGIFPTLENFCGLTWHESLFMESDISTSGLSMLAFQIPGKAGAVESDERLFKAWVEQTMTYDQLINACHQPDIMDRRIYEFAQRRGGGQVILRDASEPWLNQRAMRSDSVGYMITDLNTGGRFLFAPDVSHIDNELREHLGRADVVLFDGTFWSEFELHDTVKANLRSAASMGHVPVSGPGGSLAALENLKAKHRVYIHINNTNLILLEDSPERQMLNERGIVVGDDGMELKI